MDANLSGFIYFFIYTVRFTCNDSVASLIPASFKLLGIHISSNLKWDAHIEFVYVKSASRLHFLKVMKKSCSNTGDLICFYTTVISSVLEYCRRPLLVPTVRERTPLGSSGCLLWEYGLAGDRSLASRNKRQDVKGSFTHTLRCAVNACCF